MATPNFFSWDEVFGQITANIKPELSKHLDAADINFFMKSKVLFRNSKYQSYVSGSRAEIDKIGSYLRDKHTTPKFRSKDAGLVRQFKDPEDALSKKGNTITSLSSTSDICSKTRQTTEQGQFQQVYSRYSELLRMNEDKSTQTVDENNVRITTHTNHALDPKDEEAKRHDITLKMHPTDKAAEDILSLLNSPGKSRGGDLVDEISHMTIGDKQGQENGREPEMLHLDDKDTINQLNSHPAKSRKTPSQSNEEEFHNMTKADGPDILSRANALQFNKRNATSSRKNLYDFPQDYYFCETLAGSEKMHVTSANHGAEQRKEKEDYKQAVNGDLLRMNKDKSSQTMDGNNVPITTNHSLDPKDEESKRHDRILKTHPTDGTAECMLIDLRDLSSTSESQTLQTTYDSDEILVDSLRTQQCSSFNNQVPFNSKSKHDLPREDDLGQEDTRHFKVEKFSCSSQDKTGQTLNKTNIPNNDVCQQLQTTGQGYHKVNGSSKKDNENSYPSEDLFRRPQRHEEATESSVSKGQEAFTFTTQNTENHITKYMENGRQFEAPEPTQNTLPDQINASVISDDDDDVHNSKLASSLADQMNNDMSSMKPCQVFNGGAKQKAIISNGARPKATQRHAPAKGGEGKLENRKLSFVSHIYPWLWYKSAFAKNYYRSANKYNCEVKEKPMEDFTKRVELTIKCTQSASDGEQLDPEKCVKEIKEHFDDVQRHYEVIARPVKCSYMECLQKFDCPKHTFICDDMNAGVVIVGLNDKDIQMVYDKLVREYGHLINESRSSKTDISSKLEAEESQYDTNPAVISDDELVKRFEKITGIYTKLIQIDFSLYMYITGLRNHDLATISTRNNITIKNITLGKNTSLELKGVVYNVARAAGELVRLLTELDESISEVKINALAHQESKEKIQKIIVHMQHQNELVIFVYEDDVIRIIGPHNHINRVKQELQHIIHDITQSPHHLAKNQHDAHGGTRKLKRERKLLHSPTHLFLNDRTSAATYETTYGQKIHVFKGDITKLVVDAVVNASNIYLDHGGGVAGAISKAAGPNLQSECTLYIRKNRPLSTCGLYTSKAYNMPCLSVIHVAGPIWSDYRNDKTAAAVLRQCFKNVLAEADRLKLQSVALPAVGSGMYGAPLATVAKMMFDAVKTFVCESFGNTTIKDIILVDINPELIRLLNQRYQDEVKKTHIKNVPAECDKFNHFSAPHYPIRPEEDTGRLNEAQTSQTFHVGAEGFQGSWPISALKSIAKTGLGMVSGWSASPISQTVWNMSKLNLPAIEDKNKSSADTVESMGQTSSATIYGQHSGSQLSPHLQYKPAANPSAKLKNEDCAICLETPINKVILPICKHVFCKECIDTWFKNKPTCPNCGQLHGEMKGDQPDGFMTVDRRLYKLNGFYDSRGSIEINYSFPGGTQKAYHPHPGRLYRGTRRTAYLPDNEEGNQVLGLLKRAFDAKLTFTIGRSTTGRDDQITWNDIHHKTSLSGGPARFGYPDATYLSRVKEELASKGIK